MAVALRPTLFLGDDDDPTAADGSCWVLFEEEYPTNPRLLVDAEGWAMLRVWTYCRSTGFGGAGHLPNEGGVLDQPIIMLDALAEMTHAESQIQKDFPESTK